MDIILRLFSLAGVFVSFGEGVWKRSRVSVEHITPLAKKSCRSSTKASENTPSTRKSRLHEGVGVAVCSAGPTSTECGDGQDPRSQGEEWQNDLPKVLRFSMDINSAFCGKRPLKAVR